MLEGDPESFKSASEAAETWVKAITAARYYLDQGNTRVAYGTLLELCKSQQYDSILWDARDALAAVSDGVIRYNGLLGLQCYASAHEAILAIKKVVLITFRSPLNGIEDLAERERIIKRLFDERREGLTLSADLEARIRRERAKLLASDKTDNKTDKRKNLVPPNTDVIKLAKKIKRDLPKGGTKRDIALEFADGDERRAESLLRELRPSRYGHLLK